MTDRASGLRVTGKTPRVKTKPRCRFGCGAMWQHDDAHGCIDWLKRQVKSYRASVIGLERHAREREKRIAELEMRRWPLDLDAG